MITITNGSRTTTVTRGAFKEIYEGMGWKEVESLEPVEVPEEEVPMVEDEGEMPLSEMKVGELRQFAEERGIDISEAKNKREIIRIIRAQMGE